VKPLSALTGPVRALCFDIDETLTTHGKLTALAYDALWRAHDLGIACVPVTGRPAGWCDHIARMWPVRGVVGENGAFAMYHDGKKLRRIDVLSPAARRKNRAKLDALAKRILRAVKGSALASDQNFRDYDLAIDFCEDVRPLAKKDIARIVALFERAGATAKVSSIHVNGWFGRYDKRAMTERFLAEIVGCSEREAVFVGDSPNDQPMFAAFSRSIGVANVRAFILEQPPKFVTPSESGAGFAEVVRALASRSGFGKGR
jgi:HAD superfamily hydrolase (TIGR01484 family)